MSLSHFWASFCALFRPKGAFNLELAAPLADAADAGLAPAAATDAVGVAAAQPAAAADAAPVLVIDGDLDAASRVAAALMALSPAAPVALAAAAPALAADPVPAPSAAPALAPLDPDDESESRDELENLGTLVDGADLFVTSLKNLVSFALELGHDFEAVFDVAVARAKVLAAPKP